MPFMTNGKRDYSKELSWEHKKKPKRVKDRAARNKARGMMMDVGKVRKGDGKDVGHKQAISKGGLSQMFNLQVQSQQENRSFKRNSKGAMTSEISKKERSRKPSTTKKKY